MWRNVRAAVLNTTLQLLVIYRITFNNQRELKKKKKNNNNNNLKNKTKSH